jgi:hypothetical protein
VTPHAIHLRLVEDRERTDPALSKANAIRERLGSWIAEIESELRGELDSAQRAVRELRLVQLKLELSRLQRDIFEPLEEMRSRERKFAEQQNLKVALRVLSRPRGRAAVGAIDPS